LRERSKRVDAEHQAERKAREVDRLKREAAAAVYGMENDDKGKGKAQFLLKNYAENDDRGGKRVKLKDDEDGVQIEDEGVEMTDS
jgi:hypothetical protein